MHPHEDIHLEAEVLFEQKVATFSDHRLHTHDALEISVLQENDAKYQLLHKEHYGKPGDVFIFQPFEPHWTLVRDPDRPVQWVMILFSPSVVRSIPEGYKLLAPFYTTDLFTPHIPADNPMAQRIQQAARQAIAEENTKLPGWQAKQHMHLIDVLVAVYRCYLDGLTGHASLDRQSEPGIIRAIEYILRHFLDEIDSHTLMHLSGLGKTWFYTKFQKMTSVSPNEFITRLRLQHAVYLLKHSNKPVTDIAFECAFNSLSYFNKAFKRSKGMSPSEYRMGLRQQ